MYHAHFRLDGQPFSNTPDIRLFYPGANRGAVLEALAYALESGAALIKVIGEVGTGKTMLCRMLEAQLGRDMEIIYLLNPRLDAENVLRAIGVELAIDAATLNKVDVLNAIHRRLLSLFGEGRRVVLLVEEAQCMPNDALEEIRLLSNLETGEHKLLQIVLFGQPELETKLAVAELRQLKERIVHSFYLQPFSRQQVHDYVNHRLTRRSTTAQADIFSPLALRALHWGSRGLARRLNLIADKSLLAAFAEQTHRVLVRHVWQALKDCEFGQLLSSKNRRGLGWLIAVLLLGNLFVMVSPRPLGDVTTVQLPESRMDVSPDNTPSLPLSQQAQSTIADRENDSLDNAPTVSVATVIKHLERQARAYGHSVNERYIIQIMTTNLASENQLRGLEQLLRQPHLQSRLPHLGLFRGVSRGQNVLVLGYLGFDSYQSAKDAVVNLPEELLTYQPLTRTAQSLRTELGH